MRPFVADGDGTIRSYNETMQENPAVFAKAAGPVTGLHAVGKYLLTRDSTGAWGTHTVYDKQGAVTERQEWKNSSHYYAWAPALSRLYYFRDGSSPNDMHYDVIDQSTGKITGVGETPYHGAYNIVGPIRVSPAGDKVLLGSGDIYAGPDLLWSGNVGALNGQVEWIAGGELVTLTQEGQKTRLVRYSQSNQRVEEMVIDGIVLGLSVVGNSNHLIVKKTGQLAITAYVPSDDSDGDGVTNTVDKFPLDKTAAADSDNDGFPDAFLAGANPADSPTGLRLDAYPNDPECHNRADGDGTTCYATLNPPAFLPDAIFAGEDGTVYLVNREAQRIYRYRPDTNSYLAPLALGRNADAEASLPTIVRHVASHDRVYFGYSSGLITYVNLNGDGRETRLGATAMAVQGLAGAGNFLLAQDYSGAWATHYVFDQQGVLRDSKDWNYYSTDYDWAPAQQRLYFFRSSQSPSDVHYEVIDQGTGKITAEGESPDHGSYNYLAPIRVSAGGTRLYTGAGNIYNAADLTVLRSLDVQSMDARWMPNGMLVTLAANGQDSVLRIYDGAYKLLHQTVYAGAPKALYKVGARVLVVTTVAGKLSYTMVPI